jgi:hypothetical protein
MYLCLVHSVQIWTSVVDMHFPKSVNIKSLDKIKLMIVVRDLIFSFFELIEEFTNAFK